jgi:hypothetical protein
MVQHCLDAFGFEPGLKQAWVSVSLDWALHARSRHLACRSQQVMRSLRPQLTGDMCSILLLCLQQCLAAAEGSAVARDVALEVLLTLRELLESLPAHKLLLYPQVRAMCWSKGQQYCFLGRVVACVVMWLMYVEAHFLPC